MIAQWSSDISRREHTDGEGWRTLQFIAADIYRTPQQTIERVHRALVERGEPGVPTNLSDTWRPHFPGQHSGT